VGTAASALLFDERLHLVEMLCGVVVVTGVLLGAGAGRTRRAAPVRPEVTGPHDVRAGGPREQRV
jgi:hypothetical protein